MMRLRGFNILFFFLITSLYSQRTVKGKISINENFDSKNEISVYEKNKGFILKVLPNTQFEFITNLNKIELIFIFEGYPTIRKNIDFSRDGNFFLNIEMKTEELSEVVVSAKRKEVFLLKKMGDFEKTEIYAGKKTEVILIDQSMANLAANNSRQIYNQIPGLNIYQNDDAG